MIGPVFYYLGALVIVNSFNLEPRIALWKKGPAGSYFGLAVSPHQILEDDNRIDSTLLVGAPLDTYGRSKVRNFGKNYKSMAYYF